MDLKISHNSKKCSGELKITGSKSETNRLLLLKALFSDFEIKNTQNIFNLWILNELEICRKKTEQSIKEYKFYELLNNVRPWWQ